MERVPAVAEVYCVVLVALPLACTVPTRWFHDTRIDREEANKHGFVRDAVNIVHLGNNTLVDMWTAERISSWRFRTFVAVIWRADWRIQRVSSKPGSYAPTLTGILHCLTLSFEAYVFDAGAR